MKHNNSYSHLFALANSTLTFEGTLMLIGSIGAVSLAFMLGVLEPGALFALPFFIMMPCGAGECGCDGSCDADGSCDGSDACACSCGSNCSNCGQGECASDDGGVSDGVAGSTPYLYIKKSDGVFEMQNDVMIGSPTTYVQTKKEGELKKESDMLGVDLYPTSLDGAQFDAHGGVELQLKEIEPEESFIHSLKVHCYNIDASRTVLQHSNHQTLFSADLSEKVLPKKILLNGAIDCAHKINLEKFASHSAEKLHSLRVEKGDILEFVVDGNVGTHLIISSFWRDWVAGQTADSIHGIMQNAKKNLIGTVEKKVFAVTTKMAILGSMLFSLFAGSPHTGKGETEIGTQGVDNELLAFIKKCNSVNVAHADTPHGGGGDDADSNSLVVSYRHPAHGLWVYAGTVLPRAYMPTDVVLSLPEEAFDETKQAAVKIEATKRHYVKGISIIGDVLKREVSKQVVDIEMNHTRGSESIDLPEKISTSSPLHMVAGDTLSLKTKESVKEFTHVSLEISGYYMPLSVDGLKLAGEWKGRRTPREQELMESIYGG